MKKIIEGIFFTVAVVFLAWFAISYIEVICKNMAPNPIYWDLNLFKLLFA